MKEVLWLNKETLEERLMHPYYCFINPDLWVKVPEGATFATGDKDNFLFRKDGWYYDDQKGEWVETNVLLKHFPEYKYIKMFWVKSDIKARILSNNFTVTWEQVFGEKFVDSVSKAVKQNKSNAMKKDGVFTLERLLGCEVLFDNESYYVNYTYCASGVGHLILETDTRRAYISDFNLLTFFTEEGDELTFDEYVNKYYGGSCVQS